jgi:sugar lactone lactonase YvrE
MRECEMELFWKSTDAAIRFLPEGPYPASDSSFSWVAIQHSATSVTGSLMISNWQTGEHKRHVLLGRPGFAFPTTAPHIYVIGMERHLVLFNTEKNIYKPVTSECESHISGTVINDAVATHSGIIFGCKDLQFAEKKAGLYFFRLADHKVFALRNDQICSNGKVVLADDGSQVTFLDIDTPTKAVVKYTLQVATGKLSEPQVMLDLNDLNFFPDGMIATPDNASVIISFYNPHNAPYGETRQYSLSTGELEAIWKTPGAPQATCPQLLAMNGEIKLIVTTAVEHMSAERQQQHPNSGALFIANTAFQALPNTPQVALQWE